MGLFGSKEDPEDLIYQAMALLEKNQPKAAVGLFNKALNKSPKNRSPIQKRIGIKPDEKIFRCNYLF